MLRVAESSRASDTGRHRSQNEDRSFARAPLFAVADGMGGGPAGEVAAQIAVDVLEEGLPDGPQAPEERLASLVIDANKQIHAHSVADPSTSGMGTTMTTAWVDEAELAVAHVGDSRLYCLRGGELTRVTRDHSLVQDLIQQGRLTEEEAEDHPQRSIVTRIVGAFPDVLADHFTWRALPGDVYLICSDGLTDMVREARVRELLLAADGLASACRALVAAANAAGGKDNITVVLFRLEEVPGAPGADEATLAGRGPTTAEVRAALAAQEAEGAAPRPGARDAPRAAGRADDPRGDVPDAGAPVARRLPLAPAAALPRTRRRRRVRGLRALGFVAVFGLPVLLAAFIASQSVYFIGTNPDGFVTLYRGLPYDGPAGIELYSENFVSGVTTQELVPRVQATVTGHELRSRADGADLVRQLELGRLEGQAVR